MAFKDSTSCDQYTFDDTVSKVWFDYDQGKCKNWIRSTFDMMLENRNETQHWELYNKYLLPCTPITTGAQVLAMIQHYSSVFSYMAMINYPYPTSFLEPVPANVAAASCAPYANWTNTTTSQSAEAMVVAFAEATAVYTNHSGQIQCTNIENGDDAGGLDAGGWEYQQCTQLPMPNNTRDTSLFPATSWSNDAWTEFCQGKYNTTPAWDWAFETFGGYNFS